MITVQKTEIMPNLMGYEYRPSNSLAWVMIIKNGSVSDIIKVDGTDDIYDPVIQSIFPMFYSGDMLELIQYAMNSAYSMNATKIEDVVEWVMSCNHAISDGVMSGFADYLDAMKILIDSEKLNKLEAYCLANGYQWDERLKGA